MNPVAGQLVRVRSRQYLVEGVDDPVNPDDSPLVRLSCLEDDAQGEPLEVLWQREVDARIIGASSWEAVAQRGFDQPELFAAYLNALRWNCVTSTNTRLFQAPYRAGIQVRAFQLEPLRKALLMPRINLFIADDVGVGKTIEAGLILRELLIRQKVRRVLISCPPSVVRQWRDEMESRFGLPFVILDREYVVRCRQERGYGVNPWSTHSRFILSHALLRDETYAGPLRVWLGDFAPGSMLILDEAHNAAPASGTKYAVDSYLTAMVRDLSPRFEHRLFLSATPHNGHSNSFSALLEMLDPQRFCRGMPVLPHLRDEVMVRRLKSDIRELADEDEFPDRQVIPVVIDGLPSDAAELKLSRLLQEYRQLREKRLARVSRSRQNAAQLVFVNLQKRLLSSIEAFVRTLKVHQDSLRKVFSREEDGPEASSRATREFYGRPDQDQHQSLLFESPGADDPRAEFNEADVESEEEAEIAAATTAVEAGIEDTTEAGRGDTARRILSPSSDIESVAPDSAALELKLLDEMMEIALKARHEPDPRLKRLIEWIRTGRTSVDSQPDASAPPMCPDLGTPGARWSDRRVIFFTEYTDTKRYLVEQLELAIEGSDQANQRIAVFHGGMGEESRDNVAAAFNAHPSEHPLRILIATDAAREGLNLQNHCADLFHFDVPWNPSRMEQRNGRIDRKLQKSPIVRCHYFILPQRPEDRVIDTLVSKTATIHKELGSISPTIERRLNQLLLRGIPPEQAQKLADAIARVDRAEPDTRRGLRIGIKVIEEELEATRKRRKELQAQLTELRSMLTDARAWLNFGEEHFRQALSASLGLLGAQPLKKMVGEGDGDAGTGRGEEKTPRWVLPDLELRFGGDPAWIPTLDSLRVPPKRGQKYWEWRRENPIRPIIFNDTGEVGGKEVHLHLEHRLVQRLLNRFLAQGFLYDELTRAAVCLTEFTEPRVIALGRLSLYGARATRLHDELVTVAARWEPPELRGRRKLSPLGEGEKKEVMTLLEASLGNPRLRKVPESKKREFQATASRDVEDLLPALKRRAQVLEERARKALQARGEAEAEAMASILQEQRRRIEARLRELESPPKPGEGEQLEMFPAEELKQLEADRHYWPRRLEAIHEELKTEPDRIRATYEVKAVRVEPAGLVYLWPVSD